MALDVREVHARAANLLDPRIRGRAVARRQRRQARNPARSASAGASKNVDDLAARPPARARRPAVDAGRSDGVDERAVGAPIAGDHGRQRESSSKGYGLFLLSLMSCPHYDRSARAAAIRFLRANLNCSRRVARPGRDKIMAVNPLRIAIVGSGGVGGYFGGRLAAGGADVDLHRARRASAGASRERPADRESERRSAPPRASTRRMTRRRSARSTSCCSR